MQKTNPIISKIERLDSQREEQLKLLKKDFKKNLSLFAKSFCKEATEKLPRAAEDFLVSSLRITIYENAIAFDVDVNLFDKITNRTEEENLSYFISLFTRKDGNKLNSELNRFMKQYSPYLLEMFGCSSIEVKSNGRIAHYPD